MKRFFPLIDFEFDKSNLTRAQFTQTLMKSHQNEIIIGWLQCENQQLIPFFHQYDCEALGNSKGALLSEGVKNTSQQFSHGFYRGVPIEVKDTFMNLQLDFTSMVLRLISYPVL